MFNKNIWILITILLLFSYPVQAKNNPGLPSGIVMFWPIENGAIPQGWHEYELGQDRFLMGSSFTVRRQSTAGGSATLDLGHSHLANLEVSNDTHAHGVGSYAISREAPPETIDAPETGPEAVFADVTHTHDLTGVSGAHTHAHTVTGATDSALGVVSNMPPFVRGVWIQRD